MANRFLSIGRGFSWRCPLWSTSGKMVGFGFPIHGLWPCPISWDFCRIYIYVILYIYIIYIYTIYNIYIYTYIYWRYFTNLKLAAIWRWFPESDFHHSRLREDPRGSVNKKDQSELEQKPQRWAVPWTPVIFWIFGSLKIAGYCGMTLGITLYHTLCQSRSIYITRYHPFGRSWNFGNTPKTCIEHPILGAIPWFRQRMLGDL